MTSVGDVASDLAPILEVLANPTTLRLLQALLRKDGCMTENIEISLPLSHVEIASGLGSLRNVGIVQGVVEGPHPCFCINMETLSKMRSMLTDIGLTASVIDDPQ